MIVYYLTGGEPDEQIPRSSSPETSNVPDRGENSSDRAENTNLLNGEQSQDNLSGDLEGWDTDSIHSIT